MDTSSKIIKIANSKKKYRYRKLNKLNYFS